MALGGGVPCLEQVLPESGGRRTTRVGVWEKSLYFSQLSLPLARRSLPPLTRPICKPALLVHSGHSPRSLPPPTPSRRSSMVGSLATGRCLTNYAPGVEGRRQWCFLSTPPLAQDLPEVQPW